MVLTRGTTLNVKYSFILPVTPKCDIKIPKLFESVFDFLLLKQRDKYQKQYLGCQTVNMSENRNVL